MIGSGWILVGLWLTGFSPSDAVCRSPVAFPDPGLLARRIDKQLTTRWNADRIKPASLADDSTFIRRLFLDLIGRIPTVSEVCEFLEDKAPEKRRKWVSRLICSPAHATYWATFWRREWIPQVSIADDFEGWLTPRLRDGVPYNQIVHDLLTVPNVQTQTGTPDTFFAASEYKPENLAANTTRAFLGINLDCAQCHDHPFARWSRNQFWETAAFFVRVPPRMSSTNELELAIPNTRRVVKARLLTDPQPQWPQEIQGDTGRILLTNWVTAGDNPYFARNAVNRIWSNLFGTGLVEPIDDLSGENPASHPELLEELAAAFVESRFDLKYLTSAIVLTNAYQLSSASPNDINPRAFAGATVRGLTGEQLYDSLRVAAGLPVVRNDLESTKAQQERNRFVERYRVERSGTVERSILQALSMMNGKMMGDLTKVNETPTLRVIADAPFLSPGGKIETMYLAAFGRKAKPDELELLVRYVGVGGANGDIKEALADVFWALLNSSEFSTNH